MYGERGTRWKVYRGQGGEGAGRGVYNKHNPQGALGSAACRFGGSWLRALRFKEQCGRAFAALKSTQIGSCWDGAGGWAAGLLSNLGMGGYGTAKTRYERA